MDPESRDAINDGGRFLLGKDRKFEGVEGVAAIGHSVKMFAVWLEVERLAEMIAATMQTVLEGKNITDMLYAWEVNHLGWGVRGVVHLAG